MGIIKEFQSDLDNAAVRVVGEYRARLHAEAAKLCGDASEADDLVMRTFDAAFRDTSSYDATKGELYPWLVGVLRRIYAKTDRRLVNRGTTPVDPAVLQDLAGISEDTVDEILERSDHDALREAMNRLDPEYKKMLVMHYFGELPVKQIATVMNMPVGTVLWRLNIARKILARDLGEKLGKKPVAVLLAALLGIGTLFGAWVSPLGDWVAERVFGSVPAGAERVEQTSRVRPVATGAAPQTGDSSISQAQNTESNDNMNISAKIKKVVAATAVAAMGLTAQASASSSIIEVVSDNLETGEFTLRLPAADRELMLYFAKAGEGDSWWEWSQWRNPLFVHNVPAGTTEVSVTVPPLGETDAYRFILADPARATAKRVDYLIGGKNDSGEFNSAFLTGLHPNWDWRYEITFSVPQFANGLRWLLCHRDSNDNKNSLLLLAVRGTNGKANDHKLRFGHGKTGDVPTTGTISEGVVYQASINAQTCVYSNLTENVEFERVAPSSLDKTLYGRYNLCFGASVGGTTYNPNDGCSFARVYSFKAWDVWGALKADYRPLVLDGVAGYFDVVTRTFFKSGDGFDTPTFTPYVASEQALLIDTLAGHLGEAVAVSLDPHHSGGLVSCESESVRFAKDETPIYGEFDVAQDASKTFDEPVGTFLWTDEARKTLYRVRSAGFRIDVYDELSGKMVVGDPQRSLKSYTFTRKAALGGVRVVCLWDAELHVDAPQGRRANCLRLVSVDTDATGKTAVGDGPFNTGVHPVPAKTRVFMDVSISTSSIDKQNGLSPCNERRFFGVRDESLSGDLNLQYVFQVCRVSSPQLGRRLRVDMCNYLNGASAVNGALIPEEDARYRFDVNPYFTKVVKADGTAEHLAELKNVSVQRSSEPLQGTLHIFGQQRLHDKTAPLCVDYNGTRYYDYAIWLDGEALTHDYVPCLDAENKPAFYDRVAGDYLYPIGDKAVYQAEFEANAGAGSVQVLGENEKGELAAYVDPDGAMPGEYELSAYDGKTFTATQRVVFNHQVIGYRIDTWTDDQGWVKGSFTKGTSVTLQREESVRRLVWIWRSKKGLVVLFY